MKTVSIDLYDLEELKEVNPSGYDAAYNRWKEKREDGVPWQDEIMDSLKELINAADGVNLLDWSIGFSSPSYIELGWENSDAKDFRYARAQAWLENHLLSDLRITHNTKYHYQAHASYRSCDNYHLEHWGKICRPYTVGMIPPCPFTGYCADEDFLESLEKDIKSGMTLGDAFLALADVASHLMELEYENSLSEEEFNMMESDTLYTLEGEEFHG